MSETQTVTTVSKRPPSSDTESREDKRVKLDMELSEDILHKIQSELVIDHIGRTANLSLKKRQRIVENFLLDFVGIIKELESDIGSSISNKFYSPVRALQIGEVMTEDEINESFEKLKAGEWQWVLEASATFPLHAIIHR
jgi:predicted transcriptional regulator